MLEDVENMLKNIPRHLMTSDMSSMANNHNKRKSLSKIICLLYSHEDGKKLEKIEVSKLLKYSKNLPKSVKNQVTDIAKIQYMTRNESITNLFSSLIVRNILEPLSQYIEKGVSDVDTIWTFNIECPSEFEKILKELESKYFFFPRLKGCQEILEKNASGDACQRRFDEVMKRISSHLVALEVKKKQGRKTNQNAKTVLSSKTNIY